MYVNCKMDSEKSWFGAAMGGSTRPSWAFLLLLFTVIALSFLQIRTKTVFPSWVVSGLVGETGISEEAPSCARFFRAVPPRKVVMSMKDFGGVGDGVTSNTETFRRAIRYMQSFGNKGGAQLNVPRGRWVTGSFNLTSNFTLFLEEGAVILGSQVRNYQSKNKNYCFCFSCFIKCFRFSIYLFCFMFSEMGFFYFCLFG